ncbi:protein PET100 homolog, mitochondrial-like [Glandiceps talaboti]
MGGWKLEVGKMTMYVFFPVALFFYFNQPELFEDYISKRRRYLFPPEDLKQKARLEDFKEKMRQKKGES